MNSHIDVLELTLADKTMEWYALPVHDAQTQAHTLVWRVEISLFRIHAICLKCKKMGETGIHAIEAGKPGDSVFGEKSASKNKQ